MREENRPAANLRFSHMGLSVRDLPKMQDFYTRVLGFTVTDHGHAGGMEIIFLSRDPNDHHQIVLASGRPDNMPANTANTAFGPSINQISFQVGSLSDLRDIGERIQTYGTDNFFPANHGIAWSIYAHDPEGNNLEFFVDTEWYFPQPFLIPLELDKSDEELYALTERFSKEQPGYEPYSDWRVKVAKRMTRFMPRTFYVGDRPAASAQA